MASHTTQMVKPQPEKNSKVNQSTSEAICRCNVGRAKAARLAIAGSAKSKVRSDEPVNSVASRVTHSSHRGSAMWRLPMCLRHRISAQPASGHAGQVNHTSNWA